MISDTAYVARRLQHLGEWDAALTVLDPGVDDRLRADIAVERWFFQLKGHDEAEAAVAALDQDTPEAALLRARLAYSRLLLRRGTRPDDRADAEAGYREATRDGDEATRAWAEFYWGALLDNIDRDGDAAVPHFEAAHELGLKLGDAALESIAIRHLAAHVEAEECVRMLRRSLHLRAAIGTRPQTLAAQATLASELSEDDPERTLLTETVAIGAAELNIPWLLGGNTGSTEDFED